MSINTDVRELCTQILNMDFEFDNCYNGNHPNTYSCPICGCTKETWKDFPPEKMETFAHSTNCGYLIAKDLMTNIEPKEKNR